MRPVAHADLDELADVREGLVGDLLGAAHERDLLVVLDHAQVADVAVQARGEAGHAGAGELDEKVVVEGEVAGVLHGRHASALGGEARGRPRGRRRDLHVEGPGAVCAQALDEGVVVAGVGVEPLAGRGDHRGVGDLVVEGALSAGEPA